MAFSRKKKNGKLNWYARFKDGNGVWQEELCRGGKRDAESLEKQRKREVESGEYRKGAPTSGITLAAYATEWLGKRRNKTRTDDEQRIRDYVLPALGKVRMRDLTAAACIEFVRSLVDRGTNPKTISNVWGALRTMLRDAGIEGVIGFSPVMPRGIIPARAPKITDVYSDTDVLALLSESSEPGFDLFCAIAFYTGMRQGEICGLKWSDWEASARPLGSLMVRRQYSGEGDDASTKTGRMRIVPVHATLARIIDRAYQSRLKSLFDPIVPLRCGEHHTKSTSYKAFVRHCGQLGVASLGVHRTRHTAITAMRRGGVPAAEVERVTHNSSGTIVDRYTHDWTILCAAVSAIDYASRGLSRGVDPKLPSKTEIVPGSIPGASTGQDRNSRDNRGQITEIGGPDFSGIPVLSASRGALRENALRDLVAAANATLKAWDERGGVGGTQFYVALVALRDALAAIAPAEEPAAGEVTASDLAGALRWVLTDMLTLGGAEDGTPLPASYDTAESLLARFDAQNAGGAQ